MELRALQELQWSLEISAKDWSNWLLHLRTSNITLERTRPTTQRYHFVVARLIQDAILEAGLEKEELAKMGISPKLSELSFVTNRNSLIEVKKSMWNDTSPTLVASSQGSSPPVGETLHTRVNVNSNGDKNIADGPYGLYALQRKLENVQRDAILNPKSDIKYIPWDTSLDPVVHVQGFGSRSRSGSGSTGRLSGDQIKAQQGTNNCVYDTSMSMGMNGHSYHISYGQWGGRHPQMDAYGSGGAAMTCADVLGRGYDYPSLKPLDYSDNGTKGMTMIRPLKTCNTVALAQGQGFDNTSNFDPMFPTSWTMRL